MAITYNGTNITDWTYNTVTGVVTYNGTQIWPEATTKTWVGTWEYTSEPDPSNYDLSKAFDEGCSLGTEEMGMFLEEYYPAANYSVGTTAIVWDFCSTWYQFEVQLK